MSQWCRLWEDMPNDPKWRVVAKRAKRPVSEVLAVFIHMMVNAANAGERSERGNLEGWSDEDIAIAIDAETEHVTAIREAMQGKTLEGDHLTGWERRQPLREDGSAERAKAWREQKRLEVERLRTQPNAGERPEAEAEAEENRLEAKQAAAVPLAAREPAAAAVSDEIRYLEALCRHALASVDPPKGSFYPMVELVNAGHDPDRIAEILKVETARGRKPVGTWKLWAEITLERLTEAGVLSRKGGGRGGGNGNSGAPCAPSKLVSMRDPHGPKVSIPIFGEVSVAFLRQELAAGRWRDSYGTPDRVFQEAG